MVKAIVGANWGDEGKGKITDLLAEEEFSKRRKSRRALQPISMSLYALSKSQIGRAHV